MDMLLLIIICILSRLVPHPANFTAIGAMAIFSGSRFGKMKGLLVTSIAMIGSDFFLGFHNVMWATYGSLAIGVILAGYLLRKPSVPRVAGVTFVSSIIFYLVTNFAVWVVPGSMYPKTLSGLLESYIMAIPFFRNSVIGDLFYSGVFFGAYEYITLLLKRFSFLRAGR